MNNFLKRIPAILSSKISIYIYLFLFIYLVVFPGIGAIIPMFKQFMPSDNIQLILGNYTNVLSALGASIAAGTGVMAHSTIKKYNDKHNEMQQSIDELHQKIDKLSK